MNAMPFPRLLAQDDRNATAVVIQMKPRSVPEKAPPKARGPKKAGKPDRWMPLHIGDYLADTTELTTTEHGAYLLLLMAHWRVGVLPDDEAKLARITKLRLDHWRKIAPTVLGFFQPGEQPGTICQKRLMQELTRASDVSAKRAQAARDRWENQEATPQGLDDADSHDKPLKNKEADDANASGLLAVCTTQQTKDKVEEKSTISPSGDMAPQAGAQEPPDARTLLFSTKDGGGLCLLMAMTGKPDRACRSFLGKLLQRCQDDAAVAYSIIDEASALRPADPSAWISGAAKSRFPDRPSEPKQLDLATAKTPAAMFVAWQQQQNKGGAA